MKAGNILGETRWGAPSLQRLSKLKWEKGTGSFEGGKVALVGKDSRSGTTALFLKMPPKGLEDAHGGMLHSHTSTSHTLVIKGSVSAIIGGKKMTMKAGDYFRLPAGVPHQGSIIPGPDPTIVFMVTEGKFGLEFTKAGQKEPSLGKIKNQKAWNMAGLHEMKSLSWRKGSGSLEGGKVAVVAQDSKSGAHALFLNMPPKDWKDAHGGKAHSHSSTSHTIVLKGAVSAEINGKKMTMKPGDYFRLPAGFTHKGSHVPGPGETVMFMMSDGKFELNMEDSVN